ncbi:MAG TPA: M13 family metallopeptidase [Candidatus Competibacter sp.]|nr:M13 family metallopeptidase [Candidatus Competibacter sp.]
MKMRIPFHTLLSATLALGLTLTCSQSSAENAASDTGPVAAATSQPGAWGVDLGNMDTAVKPSDDFYRYVNGTWQDKTEIPADKTAIGPAYVLQDIALEQMKTLAEEDAADTGEPKGSEGQKIGDWYASLMDEDKLAADGLKPIQPDLERIQAINDRTALADLLADSVGGLGPKLIGPIAEADKKHKRKIIISIVTLGMSLPVRDIYLKDEYAAVRKLYLQHLARVFTLAGMDDADQRAVRVLGLETEIAKVTLPKEETRDPRKVFNPTPAKELSTIAPGIDWSRYLERTGVSAQEIVNVKVKSTVAGIIKLIAEAPLEDWRDYCTYHLIHNVSGALPKPYRDEFFSLFGKVLAGQQEPDPRWKTVLVNMAWKDGSLRDAMGKEFVERYVPAETRPKVREMVDNILKAFDARLAKLEWMTSETRAEARDKLAKTTIKVVYPDYWEDTKGLEVVRGDAIGNLRRGAAFMRQQNLSQLTNYPDKRKFLKPDIEVNAYANPDWNEIVFLAAIIRPPYFDPEAEPVVNYGALGQVIGHEISHLFDDQGRLYDGDGLLRDWWTPKDAQQFEAVASRLAKQMSSYEPLPGKHVNGKLILGESLADVAGIQVAYDAYRLSLHGKELPVVDGFTGDQRFFIGYAQAWRMKPRDAYLDQLLKTDFHPPSNVRPQTVRNIDAWYVAFNVKPGDKLYLKPEDRVQPW